MPLWIMAVATSVIAITILIGILMAARMSARLERTLVALEEMARALAQEASSTLQNVNSAAVELRELGNQVRTDLSGLERMVQGAEKALDAVRSLTSLLPKQSGSVISLAGIVAGLSRGLSVWRKLKANKGGEQK